MSNIRINVVILIQFLMLLVQRPLLLAAYHHGVTVSLWAPLEASLILWILNLMACHLKYFLGPELGHSKLCSCLRVQIIVISSHNLISLLKYFLL